MSDLPRVGIDALAFESPMTGTGQYALNLWQQLTQHYPADRLALLTPADAPEEVRELAGGLAVSGVVPKLPKRPRKVWWEQAGLPNAARRAGVDLVHLPHFAAPALQRVPYVVTIHDVIPLVLPAYAGSTAMKGYLNVVRRTTARAAMILTDSEHARNDISRVVGIDKSRIRVVPLAAGPEYHPVVSDEDRRRVAAVREKYGLERPFVLNVGGFDRRKRLPELVAGFAMAMAQVKQDMDLVIVGAPHTGNEALYPSIEPIIKLLDICDRVKLVGFVPSEDLPDLYRAADVFAFASEYEGFGLDPLEALATGLPVVSSNRSSLPEVVGDAGVLVEPTRRAIARGLVQVLSDDALRAELSAKAIEQAARFSWERTGELTIQAYLDIHARGRKAA